MLYPIKTAVVWVRGWYLHIGVVEGLIDASFTHLLGVLKLVVLLGRPYPGY
jgi:hypothetical protein